MLQDLKDKIDGYHTLVVIGEISEDDCGDAIGALIGREDGPNADIFDELHDYKFESYKRIILKNGVCK